MRILLILLILFLVLLPVAADFILEPDPPNSSFEEAGSVADVDDISTDTDLSIQDDAMNKQATKATDNSITDPEPNDPDLELPDLRIDDIKVEFLPCRNENNRCLPPALNVTFIIVNHGGDFPNVDQMPLDPSKRYTLQVAFHPYFGDDIQTDYPHFHNWRKVEQNVTSIRKGEQIAVSGLVEFLHNRPVLGFKIIDAQIEGGSLWVSGKSSISDVHKINETFEYNVPDVSINQVRISPVNESGKTKYTMGAVVNVTGEWPGAIELAVRVKAGKSKYSNALSWKIREEGPHSGSVFFFDDKPQTPRGEINWSNGFVGVTLWCPGDIPGTSINDINPENDQVTGEFSKG